MALHARRSLIRCWLAELGFPLIDAGVADAVLAAKLRDRRAGFVFFQDADDLFVGETVALHSLVLSMGQSLLQNGLFQRGKVTGGPPFLWGPVALWLLLHGSVGWGIFVAIWGLLLVSSIDNFLRPYLLNQNSNLPVLLGLFGLIGGVLAFGLIGLFLGPTLLAVAYNLFLEWVAAELEDRIYPRLISVWKSEPKP